MSMNFHLAPEDEPRYIERRETRREPPSPCVTGCGADADERQHDGTCGAPKCRMDAHLRTFGEGR